MDEFRDWLLWFSAGVTVGFCIDSIAFAPTQLGLAVVFMVLALISFAITYFVDY